MFHIAGILPRAKRFWPDKLAAVDGETRLTYAGLAGRAEALAGAFDGLGLAPGDRVAILDVNSHRYLEAYYACAQRGLILVPLNLRLAPAEMEYILNDAAARAMIVTQAFFEPVAAVAPKLDALEFLITAGEKPPKGAKDYETLLADAAPTAARVPAEPDEISHIYYTSGTTGEPKGVCLTWRNMAASTLDAIVGLEIGHKDVWLHGAPLFHLVDAWATFSLPLVGGTQVAMAFEPERAMATIQKEGVTMSGLPPTLINMMANHPRAKDYSLASLRHVMYGGSPTPIGVLRAANAATPFGLVHAYGITETSGITTISHPEMCKPDGTEEEIARTYSTGWPVPHCEVAVVDDDGKTLAPNEAGEVVVAGDRVMREYWNKPEATAAVLKDGWYHTGDMGYLDETGALYVVDRKKDMIITGGENVYSAEVESALSSHPAVLQVAVIGVPDEKWGEAVKAVVVLREGTTAAEEELIAHARQSIAGYKVPRSIDFSAEPLPVTGPGKIAKRRLRDKYWERQDRKI